MLIKLTLPLPPSLNRLFRAITVKTKTGKYRSRPIKSNEYRIYESKVIPIIPKMAIDFDVSLHIVAHYENNRRRDLDNLLKATQDVLVKGGLLIDDSLIACATIGKGENRTPACLDISVERYEKNT